MITPGPKSAEDSLRKKVTAYTDAVILKLISTKWHACKYSEALAEPTPDARDTQVI